MPLKSPFTPEEEALIQKTLQASAFVNGALPAEMANSFIDLLVDESKLLGNIRVERKTNRAGEIDFINVAEPITESDAEAQTVSADTLAFTTSKIEYQAVKTRSFWSWSAEFLDSSIELEAIAQKLIGMASKRIAMDFELLALLGDDDITLGGSPTKMQKLLVRDDGFLKSCKAADGAHIINAEGKTLTFGVNHANLDSNQFSLYDAYLGMPLKYANLYNQMRWFVSPRVKTKALEDFIERDNALTVDVLNGSANITPYGISMLDIPLWPLTLKPNALGHGTYTGADANDATHTSVLLTIPSNLIQIITRDLTSETERNIYNDTFVTVTRAYTDRLIQQQDLCVYVHNLKI